MTIKTTSTVNSLMSDEIAALISELGLTHEEFDTAIKTAKKKASNSRKEGTNESILEMALKANLDAMKLGKRIFKGISLDPDTSYIRDLVNSYYQIQSNRIKVANQKGALDRSGKESPIMSYFTDQLAQCEGNIQTFLDVWTDQNPIGVWLKAQSGIGPVIAAGIVAYFDITKTKTAGGFWRYIGWEGGERKTRKKGEKINYNPAARVLVWKAGSSFKMGYKREACYYGHLYAMKKEEYLIRNEKGGFAENAARELANKKFSTDKATGKTYAEGKLPAGHIDAMALRFCAKIFLSHVFDVMYIMEYGEKPPVPYAKAHLDHVHIEAPKHLDVLKPFFNEKFPDRDFDSIIYDAYHER